jgi:hypothetical protein
MAFSGHQLLPHLNVVQHWYLSPISEDNERFRSSYFDLELLPYALGGTWHALSEFAGIQRELVERTPPEQLEGLALFGLAADERDRLSYMFDNFLDAARRSQNAVIHYLSRGLKLSLPASMNDLIKRLRDEQFEFPPGPRKVLLEYWDRFGGRLKDYRDLSQHHALVTSDARLVRSAEGRVGVYLLLPSNPEVKSAGKLKFGDPEVHALPYAKREFKALVESLDWLTKWLLGERTKQQRQIALTVFRDPAVLGGGVQYRAYLPPSEEELREEIAKELSRLSGLRPQ